MTDQRSPSTLLSCGRTAGRRIVADPGGCGYLGASRSLALLLALGVCMGCQVLPDPASDPVHSVASVDLNAPGSDYGVPKGIHAYPPPGTSPRLFGLVVPDGFELPKGYARHFQVTDDGQEVDPILVFAPDFEALDDEGRPIAIPENRVVPPRLAPPGLPIRIVEFPPKRKSGSLSR